MKLFYKPTKKRFAIGAGIGVVVWLLFLLYMHVVAYESAQPDPEADAAAQVAARALGDGATPSQSTQVSPTAQRRRKLLVHLRAVSLKTTPPKPRRFLRRHPMVYHPMIPRLFGRFRTREQQIPMVGLSISIPFPLPRAPEPSPEMAIRSI
jgi:hypothetical protein